MADVRPSMLDVAKANSADSVVGLIEEVTTFAPEAARVPARLIKGTSYKTLHRTALPTASFRDANNGVEATKSTYDLRTVETYILDARIEVDKAVAEASEDGRDFFLAREARGGMEAAFIKFGSQFYTGDVAVSGFPGLQNLVTSAMTKDAGGTTASTGSSVYGVRFGTDEVQAIFGNNQGFQMSDWRVESIAGGTGKFDAYVSTLTSWVGLQATNQNAIGRLKDLTQAEAAANLDDEHIATLLELFPANRLPEVLFMNRRSLRQLRASRTATNATGQPAPFPTEAFGIPIVVTDSITSTEELS